MKVCWFSDKPMYIDAMQDKRNRNANDEKKEQGDDSPTLFQPQGQ